MTPTAQHPPLTILRLRDVKKRTGLGSSQIYSLISKKLFPSQIKLSVRASGWIENDIQLWILDRIAKRRLNT